MAKTFIKLVRLPTDEDKLGPQQKACMNAVVSSLMTAAKTEDAKSVVGSQVLRTDVIDTLTSGGELQTRQEPARILSFYQPQFKEKGLIEIVKEAEPKAEKPAKAKAEGAQASGSPAKGAAKGTPAPAEGAVG